MKNQMQSPTGKHVSNDAYGVSDYLQEPQTAGNLVRMAIVGIVVGVFIGTTLELIFSALSGNSFSPGVPAFIATFSNPNVAVLVERLCYALIGLVSSVLSFVYDERTRIPIGIATLVHVSATALIGLLVGAYLRWYSLSLSSFLSFFVLYTGIYVVIWLVIRAFIKSNIDSINRTLSHRNQG